MANFAVTVELGIFGMMIIITMMMIIMIIIVIIIITIIFFNFTWSLFVNKRIYVFHLLLQ